MKAIKFKCLLAVSLFLVVNGAWSQTGSNLPEQRPERPSNQGYITLALGIPGEIGAGFTIIHNNKHGGNVFISTTATKCPEVPSDFCSIWGDPFNSVKALSFHFTREFLSKTPMVRFGIEAGPSVVWYTECYNFTKIGIGPVLEWFTGNYTWDEKTRTTAGLSARAKLEFPLSFVCGFEIALAANINPAKSTVGIEMCLTLGKVRDRRRHP